MQFFGSELTQLVRANLEISAKSFWKKVLIEHFLIMFQTNNMKLSNQKKHAWNFQNVPSLQYFFGLLLFHVMRKTDN